MVFGSHEFTVQYVESHDDLRLIEKNPQVIKSSRVVAMGDTNANVNDIALTALEMVCTGGRIPIRITPTIDGYPIGEGINPNEAPPPDEGDQGH